mgnify:CR=1 FL=1
MLPTIEQIKLARQTIAGTAIRTPLVRLNVPDAPAEIYLKLENLQPIGSFKIRGAANAMFRRSRKEMQEGVLAASAGNMAQGAAWCARQIGVPCTVVAPDTAPETKIAAIERLGGRVIKTDFASWWRAFETRSYPGENGVFIHAFDDPLVMAGNGTIGLEILEDLPDVDAIVIPWGGGGLTCGIASAVRAVKPETKIFAAEVATAAHGVPPGRDRHRPLPHGAIAARRQRLDAERSSWSERTTVTSGRPGRTRGSPTLARLEAVGRGAA